MAPRTTSSMLGWRGGGDRDRVAVAAQAGRDPEDVDLLDGRCPLGLAPVGALLLRPWCVSFLHWVRVARRGLTRRASVGINRSSAIVLPPAS